MPGPEHLARKKQREALALVAKGVRVDDVAAALNVHPRTLRTYLAREGRAELEKLREERAEQALLRLEGIRDRAIEVHEEVMNDPESAGYVRLKAAESVLDRVGAPVRSQHELVPPKSMEEARARLTALLAKARAVDAGDGVLMLGEGDEDDAMDPDDSGDVVDGVLVPDDGAEQ